MSLATRCTSCGTIFKVVQDQLKVSEGWVRCGRCNEVFNALDGLFDLERDPPPQRPTHAPPRSPEPDAQPRAHEPTGTPVAQEHAAGADSSTTRPTPHPADEAPTGVPSASAPTHAALERSSPPSAPRNTARPNPPPTAQLAHVPATHEDDALDSRWLLRSSSDGQAASERRSKQVRQSDFADARFPKDVEFDLDDSDFVLDAEPASQPSAQPRPMPEIKPGGKKRDKARSGKKKPSTKTRGDAGAGTPGFVRRANRQAQWRHPAVRATLACVGLALSGLLALQAAIAFRDALSAQYPQTQPYLDEVCALAGCTIEPWRHIEDLVVDSVTLSSSASATTAGASTPGDIVYKLAVVLRNRASVPIAAPHIELSLTDASGSLIIKRVLSPAEFGFTPGELAPGSSTTLQARLASAGGRIVGYTVEPFYP